MKNQSKIETAFHKAGGILNTKEILDAGFSYYLINRLIEKDRIERLKKGLYRWIGFANNEYAEIVHIVPKGVICLYSAAQIHELSTFVPSKYHVAIPQKAKVNVPEYPPMKLYYWSQHQYEVGKSQMIYDNIEIPIYDLEKTVCDFIKFRSKTGLDTTKEVVKNYLAHNNRDLPKLISYSKKLRIGTIVNQYLELLV